METENTPIPKILEVVVRFTPSGYPIIVKVPGVPVSPSDDEELPRGVSKGVSFSSGDIAIITATGQRVRLGNDDEKDLFLPICTQQVLKTGTTSEDITVYY